MLISAACVALALPAVAPAEQASQPTSTAAGGLDVGLFHSCAVLAGGGVRCWGFSGDGQLGYGDRNNIGDNETPGSAGPVSLGAGRTVKGLAAGDFHTCAILDDGNVRCFGYGFDGQLGYGNRNNIGDDEAPISVARVDLGAGRTAKAISAGGRHTCAILDDDSVRCWGLGEVGQLGYGPPLVPIGDTEAPGSIGPVVFGAGHKAKAISAGGSHTCAILDDDTVRCWGNGANGQLGYGNTNAVQDPSSVGAVNLGMGPMGIGHKAKAISAGDFHTCAILDDGSVRCWGNGSEGELGYGNVTTIGDTEAPGTVGPVDLGGGHTAVAISSGAADTCAVLDNGSVRCWGLGSDGRLGYGNTSTIGDDESPGTIAPVNVGLGRTAVAITAGAAHTCARLDNASVRCWGAGGSGRLGYCNTKTIGDDELPGTVGPIDLEAPGASCPPAGGGDTGTPPSTGGGDTGNPGNPGNPGKPVVPGTGGAQNVGGTVDPRAVEARRARDLRNCLSAAKRTARRKRDGARRSCLKRYGRTPGRIKVLKARAISKTTIVLSFTAPGSNGARPPAARSYLVKQSGTPIRGDRDFARAQTLRNTTFKTLTRIGTKISLTVTGLRPRTVYYYSVAALDNVSKRPGERSPAAQAKTR